MRIEGTCASRANGDRAVWQTATLAHVAFSNKKVDYGVRDCFVTSCTSYTYLTILLVANLTKHFQSCLSNTQVALLLRDTNFDSSLIRKNCLYLNSEQLIKGIFEHSVLLPRAPETGAELEASNCD